MKVIVFLIVFISVVQSFQIGSLKPKYAPFSRSTQIAAAEEPLQAYKSVELVAVNKVNIENSAAVTGGILGLVLGGPVIALIIAAITNYVAKKEDDMTGEAFRGVGKTVIESYNFLNKLNAKYAISNKVGATVGKAVDESESDVISKVKTSWTATSDKLAELNAQYDLVGKGKEIAVASATLSDAAIEKLVELNSKYDFVGSTKKAAGSAIEKVREETNKA